MSFSSFAYHFERQSYGIRVTVTDLGCTAGGAGGMQRCAVLFLEYAIRRVLSATRDFPA